MFTLLPAYNFPQWTTPEVFLLLAYNFFPGDVKKKKNLWKILSNFSMIRKVLVSENLTKILMIRKALLSENFTKKKELPENFIKFFDDSQSARFEKSHQNFWWFVKRSFRKILPKKKKTLLYSKSMAKLKKKKGESIYVKQTKLPNLFIFRRCISELQTVDPLLLLFYQAISLMQ